MIRPIFDTLFRTRFEKIRKALIEAREAEDADIMIIDEELEEDIPVCHVEEELREYIRTANITRKITHLFVHTTATRQNATVTAIQNYWRNRLGWRNPGYHIILPKEGFTVLADFNTVSNGARGYNAHGVHISYIGGIDHNTRPIDNRTEEQSRLIRVFIEEMVKRFPDIKVIGHNEVSNKACPCFQVKDEYPDFWTGK